MKQIIQSLSNGETTIKELPIQSCPSKNILIKNHYSLLSKGTEKMLLDFGKANIIGKIKQQPDKVKQTLDKIKTDGIAPTISSVKAKLEEPIQLGYSSMGEVIFIGEDITNFKVGDRVISNGPHSEIVSVPGNLCALVPDEVSDEEAAFTVISSIGLQSVRLAEPTLGETFLVIGLGLIGLITCQILKANGCNVIAIDTDKSKREIAESIGIKFSYIKSQDTLFDWCLNETNGVGVDGVIISASTNSSDPVHIAAKVSRKRGRIILLGVTGLELRRDLFYEKELTFKVSCSYGPGRYDKSYEDKGFDYPLPYVRWTEQRNFQSILELIKEKKINLSKLISHRFDFEDVKKAYDLILGKDKSLGILIKYPFKKTVINDEIDLPRKKALNRKYAKVKLGFIGAGNYAKKILIPTFERVGGQFISIGSKMGLNSVIIGEKYGFSKATTDINKLIRNNDINTIVITTRHSSHAELILKCLKYKKNIFVEKPLCLTKEELLSIKNAYKGDSFLMVGFNRRFAPLVKELKILLKDLPKEKSFIYNINAGFIEPNHWTQDKEIGGGRLLGEACHFVDLLRYLSDSKIIHISHIYANDLKSCPDNFSIHLKFKNGSIGVVNYLSSGNKAYPKERLEIFAGNSVICLNNFKKLEAWGIKGFKTKKSFKQDKGQANCIRGFLNSIQKDGVSPIPIDEIFEVQDRLISLG